MTAAQINCFSDITTFGSTLQHRPICSRRHSEDDEESPGSHQSIRFLPKFLPSFRTFGTRTTEIEMSSHSPTSVGLGGSPSHRCPLYGPILTAWTWAELSSTSNAQNPPLSQQKWWLVSLRSLGPDHPLRSWTTKIPVYPGIAENSTRRRRSLTFSRSS